MKQFYVYIYSDPMTLVPFYVGKGHANRDKIHLKRKDHNHFPNRIRKMISEGRHPLIERIYTSTEEFAYQLEMGLIKQFGRDDLGTGPLLNHTDGGEGFRGAVMKEEQKLKISAAMKGRSFGPKSEETKAKMRAAKLGKPKSEAHKLAMKNRKKRGPGKKTLCINT